MVQTSIFGTVIPTAVAILIVFVDCLTVFSSSSNVDTQQQESGHIGTEDNTETSHLQCGGTFGANGVTLPATCISSGLGIPFSASSQNIQIANQNTVLNSAHQLSRHLISPPPPLRVLDIEACRLGHTQ